jgi:D-alanine-D-alanine ligase
MKIAVLMGGISSEREISLKTGNAMLKALKNIGYDAYGIDLKHDNFLSALTASEYDLAMIALHGEYGEDGRVQAVLDILGKKYTGSAFTGSSIAMDKILTKKVVESEGILVPKTYRSPEAVDRYPVVVKPSTEGSSIGLYICNSYEEVQEAVMKLADKKYLIEEFVHGDELTAGVLCGESLGVVKIVPKSGLYDYESKYTVGKTEYQVPANIPKFLYNEAMETAGRIHEILGLSGATRSDFILSAGKLYFLEVNTSPGMTETSLLPKLATLKGYTFEDVVQKVIGEIIEK